MHGNDNRRGELSDPTVVYRRRKRRVAPGVEATERGIWSSPSGRNAAADRPRSERRGDEPIKEEGHGKV